MVKAESLIQKAIVRCLTIGPRTENQLCAQLKVYKWEDINRALRLLMASQVIACSNKRFWLRSVTRESLRKAIIDKEREYVRTYKQ